MKALIIDDADSFRKIARMWLERLSIEVSEAIDGVSGLNCLKSEGPFDFILLDWVMPNMDGIEFTNAVRKELGNKDIKIIMITSHDTMNDVGTAMSTGVDDYIVKPTDFKKLSDLLARAKLLPDRVDTDPIVEE